jgi:Mn-dependent DtxR family transcriptional regulator
VVNKQHDPTEHEERVLQVLKDGRETNQPWGYTTPSRVAERFNIPRQRVNEAIGRLEAAGWITQVKENGEPIRGLYVFTADPRDN